MKQGTLVAAGATVGGYRLVRLLGRGGMSEVWEAVHGTLDAAMDVPVHDDPAAWIDAKWLLARRQAAEARVLEESALSANSRETWRLLSDEGLTVKEAARRLGVPANTVGKTKRRIEAMIAAAEALYAADGP